MPDHENNPLGHVSEVLKNALDSLSSFPAGYRPKDAPVSELTPKDHDEAHAGLENFFSNPKAIEKLQGIQSQWPKQLRYAFQECTQLLGSGLAAFGPQVHGEINDFDAMMGCMRNPDFIDALPGAMLMEEGPTRRATMSHFKNFVRIQSTPFSKTIITMLGEFSLAWYAAASQSDQPTLQTHEFSRDGWPLLDRIRDQMLIEEELAELQAVYPVDAKIVVALIWTIAALASFMEPCVFVSEHHPRVSSIRGSKVTVSSGRTTREIQPFDCDSMRIVIEFVRRALQASEISACDMMWMAGAIAQRDEIQISDAYFQRTVKRYSSFLSHRGKDSKLKLASHILKSCGKDRTSSVFLDCLCLPQRLINRKFVFESLARAEHICVVESPNYQESEWCRKEEWYARQLADLQDKTIEYTNVERLLSAEFEAEPRPTTTRIRIRPCLVASQLVQDQNDKGREPNLLTLSRENEDSEIVRGLRSVSREIDNGSPQFSQAVLKNLFGSLQDPPNDEDHHAWAIDQAKPWSVVAQHILMLITPHVTSSSKEIVWRVVDRLVAAIGDVCFEKIAEMDEFRSQTENYLSLISAAAAFDLWYDSTGHIDERMIAALVGPTARIHDHTLLLDVREPHGRDFKLRLAVALISQDIGGFGILQNAHDPVHHLVVDTQHLSVLPCVTLHPGMEHLFDGERS